MGRNKDLRTRISGLKVNLILHERTTRQEHTRSSATGLTLMGITSFKAVVSDNGKSVPVDFLVDSGAHLTLLPLETWQTLGLEPRESMEFTLADGTHISRKVSWCGITLMERTGYTPVILGEPGDEALLGVVTLEEFGLMLNPLNRTLVPMRMLLK